MKKEYKKKYLPSSFQSEDNQSPVSGQLHIFILCQSLLRGENSADGWKVLCPVLLLFTVMFHINRDRAVGGGASGVVVENFTERI